MIVTLLGALALDLIPRPWTTVWGPEATLMTLTFWALRAPAWTGFGLTLLVSIALDVGRGAVLGQTALAAIWVVWGAQKWRSAFRSNSPTSIRGRRRCVCSTPASATAPS